MLSSFLKAESLLIELLFLSTVHIMNIPAAVSFASLLIYSAVNGIKSFISNKNWISYAALTSAITYIVTSVITNSTATVTPFVWFMLGICCCTFTAEKE